jgi:hypothetical protein
MSALVDMVTVPPEEVARLRDSLPAITDRYLFDVLGISETTWNKLRRGLPIKRVTLDRWRKKPVGEPDVGPNVGRRQARPSRLAHRLSKADFQPIARR